MNKYDLLLKGVRDIIIRHDPIGLISGGAPEDEYDCEVIKIVKLLPIDKKKMSEEIQKIFANSFDEKMVKNKDKYDSISKEIVDRYFYFFDKK